VASCAAGIKEIAELYSEVPHLKDPTVPVVSMQGTVACIRDGIRCTALEKEPHCVWCGIPQKAGPG
jgi:hypothetical protein